LTAGYHPGDIFNADECALFLKLMSNKSYVLKDAKCHGGNFSKEQITVLFAANSDGTEKLPTLVIGKSARPRFGQKK